MHWSTTFSRVLKSIGSLLLILRPLLIVIAQYIVLTWKK